MYFNLYEKGPLLYYDISKVYSMVVKLKLVLKAPMKGSYLEKDDKTQNRTWHLPLICCMEVTCIRSSIVMQPSSLHFYNIWKMWESPKHIAPYTNKR